MPNIISVISGKSNLKDDKIELISHKSRVFLWDLKLEKISFNLVI